MKDQDKSKEELIRELEEWKRRFESLQRSHVENLADLRLKEGEEHLRLLFESMHQGIVYQDGQGRVINANPAAERILGMSLAQMQGKSSENSMIKTIRENGSDFPVEEHPAIQSIRTGKPVEDVVMGLVHPDQQRPIWILVTSKPEFRDSETRPFRIFTTLTDITKRKRVEDQLREREAVLSNLVNSQTNFVLRTDLEGRYTYWNHKYEEEYGWVHEATGLTGADALMAICRHHHQRARETVAACLRQPGKIEKVELDKPTRDGRTRTTLWEFVCLTDSLNQPSEIQCMGIDITDRIQSEKELRKSNERLRQVMNSIDSFIYMADMETYELLFVNDYGKKAWGADLVGQICYKALQGLDSPCEFCTNPKLLDENGQPCGVYRWEFQNRVTHRWYDIHDRAVSWSGGKVVRMEIATDITEKREREKAIRESEKKYRALFHDSPDAYSITVDGVIKECNDELARLLGGDRTSVEGISIAAVSPEYQSNGRRSDEYAGELIRLAFETGSKSFEWIHKRLDGSEFLAFIKLNAIEYEGKPALFVRWQDITEKKKTETDLRRSEERLRLIAENSQTIIYEFDEQGVCRYISPIVAKILGFRPEEMIGKATYYDPIPEEGKAQARAIFESAKPFSGSVAPVTTRDGSTIWTETNGTPVFDETGRFRGYVGGINDITQRYLAENEIRKFRSIADNANYGNAIATLDGVLLYSNHHFAAMHGYTVEEIEGKNLSMLHNQKQLEEVVTAIAILKEKGEFQAVEIWRTRKDGSTFPSLMNAMLVYENGIPHFMWATVIDITEKHNSEAKIRSLLMAVEQSPVGVVFTNEQGIIEYVNPTLTKITGLQAQEVVGQSFQALTPGVMDQEDYDGIWAAIQREGIWQSEMINRKKDGMTYWENNSLAAVMDADQRLTGFIAIKQDITEKKMAEQEIRNLNANLERKVEERTRQLVLANKELVAEIESRKLAENALAGEKRRLDDIIRSTNTGTWEWNIPTGRLLFNERWAGMLGYTLAELTPADITTWERLVHPDDLVVARQLLERHFNQADRTYEAELRMHHKNGDWIWIFSWGSVSERDDDGRPLMMSGTHLEITERKKEEAFQEELLDLSVKLNGVPVAEIPSAISTALDRMGNFLGTDRSYVFEFFPDRTMNPTYEWHRQDFQSLIGRIKDLSFDTVPEWEKALRNSGSVYVPSVDDLPDTWEMERSIWQANDVKSVLVVPLVDNGSVIGFVGVDTLVKYRKYTDFETSALTILANMIVSLIIRKKAEEFLEMTRRNYRTFFDTIDDFLFVLDEQENIVYTNDTVNRRLGYEPGELKGKPLLMVHPEERREEAGRILMEILKGQAESCPVPLVTKAGSYIPVETRVKRGQWDGRNVIFGVTKDISAIKLSEEKFSKAFQVSAVLMAISSNDNGRFIDVNNTFLDRLGFTREEVIGRTSGELNLFADQSIRELNVNNLDKGIPARDVEVVVNTNTGDQLTGLFSAEGIYIADTKCMLTMLVDITERKNFEAEILKAKADAEKANMAKSEFLSRMSHELRTPMNSILGFAQLLDMGELNPVQKKGVGHIMHSGKHLLGLINEVLDISRIEAGRLSLSMEPVQLRSVLTESIDVVQLQANEQRISLEINESEENDLFITADRQRFKQILLNLVSNAVKYNKPDGSVSIKVENRKDAEGELPALRISVSDTGPGISEQDIPRIFQPFERFGAENLQVEGTGLGLTVTRKLIDALGGKIGVESVVGEGTTFWVEFPESRGQADGIIRTSISEREIRVKTEKSGTILYIEDNHSNIELVNQVLADQRPNVSLVTVMEGMLAVPLAAQHKPALILLDLNLPDIHGSEVIRRLKEEPSTSEIPVVIISADAMPPQIMNMLKAGASQYLAKPLDIPEFLQIVDAYLD